MSIAPASIGGAGIPKGVVKGTFRLDRRENVRGMKGCVAREVGQASSLPVFGASCLKLLEGRDDRTRTRGWKPRGPAGGDACPSAPEKALGWSGGSPLPRGGEPCGIEP